MTSIYRILLSFTFLLFSLDSIADAAAIEQLENRVRLLQQQIKENSASIASYQAKQAKASSDLETARLGLANAEISYNTASSNQSSNPSSENERALRRASDVKTLAERKVSSRQKRVNWLSNEVQQLESASANARREINQSNTKIASIQASWKAKIKRDEAAAAKKLAQQKKAEASTKTAKAKPSPKAVPVLAKLPSNISNSKKPSSAISKQDKVSELKAYIAQGVNAEPSINLRIGFSDKSGRIRFEHLGGEIYRGEAELKKGKQVVNYDGSSFRIEIASADHKKTHFIYFDNRNKGKREILVLPK